MDLVHLFRRGHPGLGPISHHHSHPKDSQDILVGHIYSPLRVLIYNLLVLPANVLKQIQRYIYFFFLVKFNIPMITVNPSFKLTINESTTHNVWIKG